MNLIRQPAFRSLSLLICAGLSGAGVSAAPAAGASGDAPSRYQQERAACTSGQSGQDRATCLKEAGAAKEEARRGNLDEHPAGLKGNAKDRCNALAGDERTDCLARMNGEGTVSGSVKGGGLLREKKTVVQGEPVVVPAK